METDCARGVRIAAPVGVRHRGAVGVALQTNRPPVVADTGDVLSNGNAVRPDPSLESKRAGRNKSLVEINKHERVYSVEPKGGRAGLRGRRRWRRGRRGGRVHHGRDPVLANRPQISLTRRGQHRAVVVSDFVHN